MSIQKENKCKDGEHEWFIEDPSIKTAQLECMDCDNKITLKQFAKLKIQEGRQLCMDENHLGISDVAFRQALAIVEKVHHKHCMKFTMKGATCRDGTMDCDELKEIRRKLVDTNPCKICGRHYDGDSVESAKKHKKCILTELGDKNGK